MARSTELPRFNTLPEVVKDLRTPKTETDQGFIVVGTFIDIGDPGNDPGTDELSPPFLNGWENKPGFQSGFRLRDDGDTEIVAAIQSGTIGAAAWILPEDYRKPYDFRILQATDAAATIVKILVKSTGEVIVEEVMVIT